MLKGTLDDFTLPDIFRLMSLSKKTGSLAVERSAGTGKVWFREGEVYYAESSLSKEPLGHKLVRAKTLTEAQLREGLAEQTDSGKRLGEVLMDRGLVDEDQIMKVVRQQIEDAAFDLLRWELGTFVWEPGDEMQPEVTLYVSVENLIMEATRRLDELEVIKRKIPSVQTILAMAAAPPEGAVEINITPEEWRILVLVNGVRTVREIGDMVGLDEFAAMRTLYGLVSAGLIEVSGEAEPIEPFVRPQTQAEQVQEVAEPEREVAPRRPEPERHVAEVVRRQRDIEDATAEEPGPGEPAAEQPAAEEPGPAEPTEEPAAEQPVAEVPLTEVDADAEAEAFYAVDDVQPDSPPPRPLQPVPDLPAEEPDVPLEAFDAPGPGELVAEGPVSNGHEDPMASEILAPPEPAFTAPEEEPAAPEQESAAPEQEAADQGPAAPPAAVDDQPAAPDVPAASEPAQESPRVDRISAVRELAGLFSEGEDEDDDGGRSRTRAAAPEPEPEPRPEPADNRKRVEDDEQVTRGLISRLIDGVKGL